VTRTKKEVKPRPAGNANNNNNTPGQGGRIADGLNVGVVAHQTPGLLRAKLRKSRMTSSTLAEAMALPYSADDSKIFWTIFSSN
jgi:hypothetical protein